MLKISTVLVAVLAISGIAFASGSGEDVVIQPHALFTQEQLAGARAGREEDVKAIVDIGLANVRGLINVIGLNRLPLPNATIEFHETIIGINITGVIGLFNGVLTGLETLHRTGEAVLFVESNGDLLANVELGVFDVALEYSLILQFLGIGPKATMIGGLSQVSIEMDLRIGADASLKLEKLLVKDSGFLKVSIKGLGFILNFIADIIANILGNIAKNMVVELIQGPILDLINAILGGLIPSAQGYDEILLQAKSIAIGGGEPINHIVNLKNFRHEF